MPGTAREISEKWQQRMAASGEAIRQGVDRVTVNPAQKAIARKDAYLAGVQRSVADGSWEDGLQRTTLDGWKRAMKEKTVPRVVTGATSGRPAMEAFLSEFLPHVEAGQRMLESMPRGDLESNIARVNAMIRHNASFRRSRR